MKKLITLFVLSFMISKLLNAQILEHQYSGDAGSIYQVGTNEYVYGFYDISNKQFNLYSLNHTLIKTINILPSSCTSFSIVNVSKTLFNNDSKYEITYVFSSTTTGLKVINEDGNVLLNEDSCSAAYIRNTNLGTKMLISNFTSKILKVYSLTGQVYGKISEFANDNIYINAFPNPSKSNITISYEIPNGYNNGDIVICNLNGVEMKRYKVDKNFTDILINTSDFASGTYLYKVITSKAESQTKKFIIE